MRLHANISKISLSQNSSQGYLVNVKNSMDFDIKKIPDELPDSQKEDPNA